MVKEWRKMRSFLLRNPLNERIEPYKAKYLRPSMKNLLNITSLLLPINFIPILVLYVSILCCFVNYILSYIVYFLPLNDHILVPQHSSSQWWKWFGSTKQNRFISSNLTLFMRFGLVSNLVLVILKHSKNNSVFSLN